MKKALLTLTLVSLFYQKSEACAWYDPDYEYFNLFTQSIIKDKSYTPFLLTYSNWFYEDQRTKMPDDNIDAWRKYFGNALSYSETYNLVYKLSLNDLNLLKKGTPSQPLLQKLGFNFYSKYKEGFDYLIEAKYLEPFMRINYLGSEDSFYYHDSAPTKNATDLDYTKTISALESLYKATNNPEIKQRYGYQLVRFNHYNRKFEEATAAFQTYVEPIKLRSEPYYMALDQLAGAQRGLGKSEDANWNFFQVFLNSNRKKQDAYVSMQISDSAAFDNLLKRAQNDKERNMAYFLLGYQDYNNPLPMMEKMYAIDPKSEMLKVLAARAINELERNYLQTYYYQNSEDTSTNATSSSESNAARSDASKEQQKKELSFWDKVVRFFKSLFGKDANEKQERSNDLTDKQYLNNPDRIPFYNKAQYDHYSNEENGPKDYLNDLEAFTSKTKEKSDDEYWKIADAYLKFLQKEYEESTGILNDIKTQNPEYIDQIKRMKMLNEIVSQPKITPEFEEHLFADYKEFFVEKPAPKKDSANENEDYYENYPQPSTNDFLKDILANRYFLQGEDAKSYLMNNKLSDFRYNPNYELAKKLQQFYNKKDKSSFEKEIISKNMDDVGNPEAFFNLVYGDYAMRNADFIKAKSFYKNATTFKGFPTYDEYYNYQTGNYEKVTNPELLYNGYKNISSLIFGHNVWECYSCDESQSMKAESFVGEFPFIKNVMNKEELADALLQLKKIGDGKGETSAKANQLIGNVLYNTSVLGYYRELFVMDVDNSNGGKYHFYQSESPFKYYYKNYTSSVFIKPDNFDLSINYYAKALQSSTDREQKARILFQMGSAEQGKYYQWEVKDDFEVPYDDPKWSEKRESNQQRLDAAKNQKFRSYFTQLKQSYSNTQTSKSLAGSCSYYSYFLTK